MPLLSSKKQINRASAISTIIVVIVLAFLINILSIKLYTRLDVTENKIYTASSATKDILKGLDDVINVKAYFTGELPGYLLVRNQEVRDMLAEFSQASKGNVLVTFLDPSKDQAIEQEAPRL